MKALIFDLDGTLFQTEKVAVPAFQEAFIWLKEQGKYHRRIPTKEEILAVTGMSLNHLWDRLLPEGDSVIREQMNQKSLEIELALLEQNQGELYPGVAETLRQARRWGWNLFIASNGLGSYVRGVLKSEKIEDLFVDVYTAGEYKTESKASLVRKCIEKHGIRQGFMIGDRRSDVEAGKANGLKVIGCRYEGFPQFGSEDELQGADYILSSFHDLLDILKR
jgi:phosphoglycolate phosphatase